MLKISMIDGGDRKALLRLEGRVAGLWVAELRGICEAYLTTQSALKLDLTDVTFADPEGIALLTGYQTRGVSLINCSPFVDEQLRSAANG